MCQNHWAGNIKLGHCKEGFMHKYGIVGGKFRLLHYAHREYFIQAMGEVEKLYIVISHGDFKRYATIAETQQSVGKIMQNMGFKSGEDYEVCVAPYFADNQDWEEWLVKNLEVKNKEDWIIFNSKENYKNIKFKNKFLKLESAENIESISATQIEEDPYTLINSNFICKEFLTYMNKKVVITGTESCGKTVLAAKLAGVFDTCFSEEYGRHHSSIFLGDQDITYQPKDFVHIAMQQTLQDKEMNEKAKRLLVVDTDPIVTLRFFYSYMERIQEMGLWNEDIEKEAKAAEGQLVYFVQKYKYDLIIMLKPNVEFLQDGIRWCLSTEERWKNHKKLKNLYKKYGLTFHEIDSSNYNERFIDAVKLIRENCHIS